MPLRRASFSRVLGHGFPPPLVPEVENTACTLLTDTDNNESWNLAQNTVAVISAIKPIHTNNRSMPSSCSYVYDVSPSQFKERKRQTRNDKRVNDKRASRWMNLDAWSTWQNQFKCHRNHANIIYLTIKLWNYDSVKKHFFISWTKRWYALISKVCSYPLLGIQPFTLRAQSHASQRVFRKTPKKVNFLIFMSMLS